MPFILEAHAADDPRDLLARPQDLRYLRVNVGCRTLEHIKRCGTPHGSTGPQDCQSHITMDPRCVFFQVSCGIGTS